MVDRNRRYLDFPESICSKLQRANGSTSPKQLITVNLTAARKVLLLYSILRHAIGITRAAVGLGSVKVALPALLLT